MTTLGMVLTGRANGKASPAQPLDFGRVMLEVGHAIARHNMTASMAGPGHTPGPAAGLGDPAAILASVIAWTEQDDDAHEPCSLTACRHPLHPGPCKGWKGTLHAVAPGTYKQLEEARVHKANARRLKRIDDLRAQNKPIPRRLLEEIKPKPAPGHPAHGAQPVPLGQVNQKADLAGGQAHAAGQAVSKAAGVQVKTAPPLPLGPKAKKPTVAGRGPAFVITQPKVTDQYKLDKAAKLTPQEWNDLTDADKKTIRDEIAAIKVRGFGPQQRKADELLAKLPQKGLAPGTPNTVTTPKGNVHQVINPTPGKISLGQASKGLAPVPPSKTLGTPPTVAPTRARPDVAAQAKKAAQAKTLTPAARTFIYNQLSKDQFDSLDDATKKQIHDDLDAAAASPSATTSKTAKDLKDRFGTPAPSAPAPPAPPSAPSTPAKAGEKFVHTVTFNGQTITRTSARDYTHASIVQKGHNGEKVVWGFHGSEANARATPLTSMQKQNGFRVVDVLPVKREPLKKGTTTPGNAPAAPTGLQPAAPSAPGTAAHVQHARAVANRTAPKASMGKTHVDAYGKLTKAEFDSLDPAEQRTIRDDLANAKGKFLDPKKQQAAQHLLDRFGSKHPAPAGPAGVTTMTPTNVAALIRKDGSADLMLGGKKVTVGFAGGGHEGKLEMVPGGLYVVTTKDGTKHKLAKGQLVTVAPKAPAAVPTHPKGYSDPVAQAVAAAHGTDDAEAVKRIGQLSHIQIDTLDAADKRTVTARLAFIATHPKADPAAKEKAAALGRAIVTGKPSGMPKLDHEPTLNEIHAHQLKTGHAQQTRALEAADNVKGDRAQRVDALAGMTKAQFDDLNPQQQRRVLDALQGFHHENSGYGKTHDAESTAAGEAIVKYTGREPAVARAKQAEADFRAGKIDARGLHTEILHAAVQAPIGSVTNRLNAEKQRIAEDNPSLPLWLRSTLIDNPYSGKRGNPYDVISQLSMEHSWKDAPRLSSSDFQALFGSTDADLVGTHPIHIEAIKKYREHVVHSGLASGSPWSTATKNQLVDSLTKTGYGQGPVIADARMKLFTDLDPADQMKVRTVLADRILSQTNNRAKTGTDITLRQLQGHPYTGEKLEAALAATESFPGSDVHDTYRKLPPTVFQSMPPYTQAAIKEHLGELQTRAERNGPTLTWTPQSNALKEFPAALAAHLDGSRTEYVDRRLRNASDVANYGQKIINPFDLTRVYSDVPIAQYRNLSGPDRAKVAGDLNDIAADASHTISVRYGAAFTRDFTHGAGHSTINADQLVAIGATDPRFGNQQPDGNVIPALNLLSKADYDSLDPVYRESIDDRIKSLTGSHQQVFTAKFHPAAAPSTPAGYTPTAPATVQPHVQEALDTIYGVHPKSHTMAHQLSTYGALRGSDFGQLNGQEQSQLLGDLSFIATTAKGPSADKAKKLIDRFTPAGTAPGQIPTQPVIPPVNAVAGQQRYATPLKGALVKAKDSGTSGDKWIYPPGHGKVWGEHGAAGLLVKHVDPQTGEERYLMVQRGPAISDPGKWTFPGGAIDSKETPHQGAARETLEELGLKDDQLKDAVIHGDHTYSIPGHSWKYTTVAAQAPSMFQPNLTTAHARAETSDAKWMTLDEIRALDRNGKLHGPIAGGKLEQNVISLYPQARPTLGQIVRPGPVGKRLKRLGLPSGGRQAPTQFNAWPHAHKPSNGKNLVSDKTAIDKLRQDVKHTRTAYDGKTGDGRLAAIGAMQGYDDTPTVANKAEMDRLLATGDYIEAWRGVKGSYGGASAAKINEDMRSGTAWYGRGIFGNGYYLATQKSVATKYSDHSKNSLVRILIPKSAVTQVYRDVQKEARANSSRTSKAKGNRYEEGTLYDAGRWAAAKGVDGIEIPHDTVNDSGGWARHVAQPGKPAFNWLNRSVLIIQEADK